MSIYVLLFLEFFKIGLFAIGGGLATLPFLYELADKYQWLDSANITDMVAVAESTPGPIGVNLATYVGFHTAGIAGGLVATFALVLPSLIIIVIIAKFLISMDQNPYVIAVFAGLRPAVVGLIVVAGFEIFRLSVLTLDAFTATGNILDLFAWKAVVLFVILLFLTNRFPKHPIFYISIAAVCGVFFQF